jgi:hypothetical protein
MLIGRDLEDRGITTPAAIGAASRCIRLRRRGWGCRCRAEVTAPTIEIDPDAIGPDGRVRLRCYLPLENSLWFFAGCQGRAGCGHTAPISVKVAIQIMGSGEATVGELVAASTRRPWPRSSV